MRIARSIRPTLLDFLGVFLLVCVVLIGGRRLFGDSDPALHVATGSFILEHREVPRTDPFSASHGGREWFAHEWLTDVVWALAHRAAGFSGLVAVSAILIGAAHVLLYRFLVRRGDDALASFLAVTAAAATASSHWLARPHLVTALLLVVWVTWIEDVVRGRRRPVFLAVLPFVLVVWVNLHGGFLVGLAILLCYLAGELLAARPWVRRDRPFPESVARARARIGPFVLALAASSAAVVVNPWGWRLPAHLLTYFAMPRSALALNQEFAPAFPLDRAGGTLLGFLLLCVAALGCEAWVRLRRRRSDDERDGLHPGTLLAFGSSALMAFLSIRHMEVLAVLGAVVLADGASALLRFKRREEARSDWEALRHYEERHGGGIVFLASIVLAVTSVVRGLPGAGYDPARFPVEMVERLEEAGVVPDGAVFAPAHWGGYLILEWPHARVFVDGRSDMYGDEFMRLYASIYSARPGWSRRLEEAGVVWALLPREAPLAQALEASPGWTLWAADSTTLAFRLTLPGETSRAQTIPKAAEAPR